MKDLNPPVDELGQKLKFSVPSKIKNSRNIYRVMTTAYGTSFINRKI